MKITKENITKENNGQIGQIITQRFGMPNLIDFVEKKDNIISVEANEDQAPTIFTIDEFVNAYSRKNLIWI